MKKVPQLRDDEADESWVHPAEAMEPGEAPDPGAGVDHFRRLLIACLPTKGYGVRMGMAKHLQAGYHRMVATTYVVSPELFPGMKPKEVAKAIGLSWWAFRKQLRAVRDMIDAREAAARRRRRPGGGPAGPDANQAE